MRRVLSLLLSSVSIFAWTAARADEPAIARGVVQDASGQPVPNAIVWAARVELTPIDRDEARTGPSGEFELSIDAGRWVIYARHGRDVGQIDQPNGTVRLKPGERREGLAITLGEGARLHGTIRDRDSRDPIGGAKLWTDEGVLIEADAQGRYEYEGIRRKDHHLYAIAPGYAREMVLFDTTLRTDAGLDIWASRGGTIRGTVRDAEGNPIAHARLWGPGSGNTVALRARIVSTDESGRYALPGVRFHRTGRIEASAPGFEETEVSQPALTPDAPELTLDFTLPSGGESGASPATFNERLLRNVKGVVRNERGLPESGATVRWITNALGADRRVTTTDAKGAFELEDIYNIQSMAMVMAPGHATAFIPLEADVTEGIEVTLEPERIVGGRVVNSAGEPIGGVRVIPRMTFVLEDMRDIRWFNDLAAMTAADGKFELTRLPAHDVTFDFLKAGLNEERNRSLETSSENVVTIAAGGAIRGKVVDRAGRPVSDYILLVQPSNKPLAGKKSGSMFAGYTGIGIHFSNADGEFVVSDLEADRTHRVIAVVDGYSDAVADPVLSYPSDRLPGADELVLRVNPPKTLSVRAVDWKLEKPVEGARIQLVDRNPDYDIQWGYDDQGWDRWIELTTNAAGRGTFASTGMGEGAVLARAPGYGRQRVKWRGAEDAIEIALDREAIVRGTAADDAGRILADGGVRLSDKKGNHYQATISPSDLGRFAFDELPAGSYTLSIERDNQRLFEKTFELRAGDTFDVDVDSLAVMRRPSTNATIVTRPNPLDLGVTAPEFQAERMGGGEVRLKDYRGKYVLLDFWATWCGPCVEETPHLRAVFDAYGDDDRFVMIRLSLDSAVSDARDYVEQNGMGWVQGFLGDWSQTPVPELYHVWGIPSIFLIGPDGKILAHDLRGEGILQVVADALDKH